MVKISVLSKGYGMILNVSISFDMTSAINPGQ